VELRTGTPLPYGHVFRSQDMGDTWQDIDGGQLPNVVFYAAVYQTQPPYRLFVAGDLGVWTEMEAGWLNINGNLPSVVVSDLVYHHKEGTLTAATYGRGVWRMRPGRLEPPPAPHQPQERIALAAGLRVDPNAAAPVQLTPPDGAVSGGLSRKTLVTVQPVPGALGYQAEFATGGVSQGASSTTPEIPFEPAGTGVVQWRVWAILPDGLRSAASPWRSVTYSR
jgi:hypothetical protein